VEKGPKGLQAANVNRV